MNLFNKLIVLLLLSGFCLPAFAAVDGVDLISCGVYSEKGDKKEGDKKKDGEEEPDCE